jgi:hypothetical protein
MIDTFFSFQESKLFKELKLKEDEINEVLNQKDKSKFTLLKKRKSIKLSTGTEIKLNDKKVIEEKEEKRIKRLSVKLGISQEQLEKLSQVTEETNITEEHFLKLTEMNNSSFTIRTENENNEVEFKKTTSEINLFSKKEFFNRFSIIYGGDKLQTVFSNDELKKLNHEMFKRSSKLQTDSYKYFLKTYQNTFTGKDFLDWLIDLNINTKIGDRKEGLNYCQKLIFSKFLIGVSKKNVFYDDHHRYYCIFK